ncbi:hypothetical protein H7827_08200 [Streptomyces sp. JH002]|jgi:hypothetical protein|uniref:Uncharacterized protein n=1 Tax=Streptomyces xiamenensis TaxID=408015 RepID=A0A0F7FYP3_9ACTN|nr:MULTISPECIES: hypothetical protein [Streptomyces]AKG45328.1 hypothetical protein SXIM_39440 [Streptomyces xiamenensis]MCU4746647.1 hypothetical protein [Streptomyces sp. G-5]QQN77375.1 hypothetical protein IPZ77_07830 [Streptomyces sp. XC 2026]
MTDSGPAPESPRFRRPAGLFFEPPTDAPEEEHFFDLESISEPDLLLSRATELAVAFQAAADRAVEYQAVAAAQLADPRRFDRLSAAQIAERAEWTEDYAVKMIEFGRRLQRRQAPHGTGGHPPLS